MNAFAPHLDFYAGGIEVFVLQFAHTAAVHRVGAVCAKAPDVEKVGASAHLFVGSEGDFYFAVLYVGIAHERLRKVHYLRHPRLVVRPQKGAAVGGNYGFALVRRKTWKLLGRKPAPCGQYDVAAVVVCRDNRLYVGSAHRGRGVHVGDEAQDVLRLYVCRNSGIYVAVVVRFGMHAHFVKLTAQQGQQVFLLFAAGVLRDVRHRLRVYFDVL